MNMPTTITAMTTMAMMTMRMTIMPTKTQLTPRKPRTPNASTPMARPWRRNTPNTRLRRMATSSMTMRMTAKTPRRKLVESVGGDDVMEEVPERAFRPRRQYKIQEVIKRRQVMLVQVVKEERGNKGAALTTYLSLAGRYAVLMPNTARGGGISRKITSAQDRSRLKEVVSDLDVPEGMGIILRTAGASRTKPEIKRDFEYLIRMSGNRPRHDPEVASPDPGLRGRLA